MEKKFYKPTKEEQQESEIREMERSSKWASQ